MLWEIMVLISLVTFMGGCFWQNMFALRLVHGGRGITLALFFIQTAVDEAIRLGRKLKNIEI